jgi:glycosyltransferase involved in cell wall biosynthesis
LTEAAYFGCPSVSVRRFAIPELVLDGQTGVLLEGPVEPFELARAIEDLLASPDAYRRMRANAFSFAREHFNWDRIGERMASEIRARLQ